MREFEPVNRSGQRELGSDRIPAASWFTGISVASLVTSLMPTPVAADAAVPLIAPAPASIPDTSNPGVSDPISDEMIAAASRCQVFGEGSSHRTGQLLLQADSLSYDMGGQVARADGAVEVAYYDCILRADTLSYDQTSEIVTAEGNVTLAEPSGNLIFAERVEFSGGLEIGVVENLGLVLGETTAKMAAASAERQPNQVTALNKVVYSPCKTCPDQDGPPLWQVKALRVVHDEQEKTITYRDATFEVAGVPVFYLPYFSHADPTVERKSGFLVPNIGNATDLGTFVETPYYWAIAPHHDATLAPLITSQEGTVFKGEYRRRTKRGTYTNDGSFIYVERKDLSGAGTGENTFRSHLFANGEFSVSPVWDWGYRVRLTSDDTYLERYEISDDDRLTSQVFAEGRSGRDFATLNAFYFQGLREDDDPGTTPLVLPLLEATWYLNPRPFGGVTWMHANVLGLTRTDGADSFRVSFAGNWERKQVTSNGMIVTGFAEARADTYYTDDQNSSDDPEGPDNSEFIARALPTLGAEWRWPFARSSGTTYQIVEPVAQLIFSPYGGNSQDIPNEDSASFEFDDTNLFSANKLPGLDLWESGPRANIGLRYGVFGANGAQFDFVFGQNFRLREDSVFDRATGLGDQQSDYVGRWVLSPSRYIDLTHRFRIDKDNWDFSRNEVYGKIGIENYEATLSYVRLSEELSESGLEEREEIALETRLKVYNKWFFEASGRRDLANSNMISSGAALVFENECAEVRLQFKRRFTRDRDIEPSSSFSFRVRLRTFGAS